MFSIDNFKSKFRDLARQYMFKVVLFPPIAGVNFGELGTVLVESTTLPTKNVTAVDSQFMGQQFKLAGNIEYPDWSVTFRIDTDYKIYEAVRGWVDNIRPGQGGDANIMKTPKEYKGQLQLVQIDGEQKEIANLILWGAFPSAIGEVTLDTKTSDVQLLPVTFAYDYHTWERL